ncbi:MAG: sulfite exporter TauE/SafE family protein [Erysipelotrichaceae bacterium]
MGILKIILVCFIAGAGAGLGTGFAGMSAATVVGPLLSTFLDISPYQAIGIGLISDVLASSISAYTYHKSGNLDIKNSLPLMISVLVMTVVGSLVASQVSAQTMGSAMQFILILLGLRFIFKPITTTKKQMQDISPKEMVIKSVIGGVLVGFICGFIGAGGGMMLLFVLTSFLGYPMHMAVGTSVFIMAFTALTGGISHVIIGGIGNYLALIFCCLFTLLWARVASKIANKVDAKTLNITVGVVMILTGVVVLVFNYL